jgi:signal peptidase II
VSEPARERRVGASKPAAPGADALSGARSWGQGKLPAPLAVVLGIVVLDYLSKLMVLRTFRPYQQVDVISDYVRLTFIQNTGAAFGLHAGLYDRFIFLVLPLVALAGLAALFWATPARDRIRLIAIALVSAGAIGNLADRLRSPRGVVDFIDVGIGGLRWPIFNVADIAVTTGAILLALSLWSEERGTGNHRTRERQAGTPGSGDRRGS